MRLRHLHDEVRPAQLPVHRKGGSRRRSFESAFQTAAIEPTLKKFDFSIAHPPRVHELSTSGCRQPGWHEALDRHLRHLLRTFARVCVTQEGKRAGPARTM